MGLFDIFTGDAYSEAADKQRQYLQSVLAQGAGNLQQAQQSGLGALATGQANALGAIQPAFGQARADILANLPSALSALYGGQGQAAGALGAGQAGGLAALQSGVQQATGAFAPVGALANQYGAITGSASQATMDALGLNGPEGIARSRQAFQTTPGYEFARDQAVDAAVRGANTAGMAASGNTLAGISNLVGNQIAPGQWNQYMSGLGGLESQYAPLALSGAGTAAGGIANAALTGGTGAANIYGTTGANLANLYSGTGTNAANLYTGAGTNLANLASQGGLAAGNIYNQGGVNQANLLSNLASQNNQLLQGIAPSVAGTYGAEAAAKTGGSANIWNLGLNLAKLGTGLFAG